MPEIKNDSYMPDENGLLRIDGVIEDIIYANKENGYTVCDVEDQNGDMVTVTGIMPYIAEGEAITIFGRWIHSPKYGRQFKAEQYNRDLPVDTASILRYLSSRTIKGIGPTLARRIVEEFGADTFDVMENHPDWLAQIKGVTKKTAEAACKDFKEKSGMRNALIFFRDYFGASTTLKIYKKYGGSCVDIAKQNPYRLCDEIDGIGFERADLIAEKMGLAQDNPQRLKSGIVYVLSNNANQNGHVCLPEDKLIAVSSAMLKCSEETIRQILIELVRSERLIAEKFDGVKYIYMTYAYRCEEYIAKKLRLLDRMCPIMEITDIRTFLDKEQRKNGIIYAPTQREAIAEALGNGVFVLTGGPGTGKTTIVKALIGIFDSMGMKVALAAPTGRAAKRMSEATSHEAKTVHRLLEMDYENDEGEDNFRRNDKDPLEESVIIIDEASMLDNALMCALLKAVKPGSHLILIGDADQLPSVGSGNVLADIISSGRYSTVRLTEIFRQAGMSLIVTNAHKINSGVMPDLTVKDNDFFFLPRESDSDIACTIVDLYRNRLPKSYGNDIINNIQVISPSKRGEAGTENLNVMLQNALNPHSGEKNEYKFRETMFRVGDKVIQMRNNYDIEWDRDDKDGCGVYNGDVGIITDINIQNSCFEIMFDDRHTVYDFSLLEDLEHAYAVTVHKSQGSEYPVVIMPAYNAPSMLLTRNMLYTAVTRAQKMVIIVGRSEVIGRMVENNRTAMRYTGLSYKINEEE